VADARSALIHLPDKDRTCREHTVLDRSLECVPDGSVADHAQDERLSEWQTIGPFRELCEVVDERCLQVRLRHVLRRRQGTQ
jgi:hypothetical protein